MGSRDCALETHPALLPNSWKVAFSKDQLGAVWLSRKGDIKGYKIRRTRALKDIQSQSRPCD